MVVVKTPHLCPFCVRRSIKHERVHGASDVAISLLSFSKAVLDRPFDPSLHVLHWHGRHVLGQNAEGSCELRGLILLAGGGFLLAT